MPKYYFFGLHRVQMYEYLWGHTVAQIQMLMYDRPKTVYKHDKSHGLKPGDKGYKPDKKKLDAAVERWKKRKAERKKQGFSLSKFLSTGKKEPVEEENK